MTHKHWSEWLADRVVEEKKEPYVITAGMTTSGPAHIGTLCEFLFPAMIKRELEHKGKKVAFYFIADIFDALDSVPAAMEKHRNELEPYLGIPLCNVPDPTGRSRSFGDHYLDETKELMEKFHVDTNVIRINEYYEAGKFDEYARFFLKHEEETREIVERTSGKQQKKDWSPIMPVCEKCGKIATTRVLSHDGENYEYVCDKDVEYTRGCGYNGKAKISDHKYKLTWRLHWPSWKQLFKSSIEGAGIDHHTKGGSEDTCKTITKELFKKEHPISFRFGFVLFKGRKYSKSKGIGMGVSEIIKLAPPEVVTYVIIKPDLEENVDINPTNTNMLRYLYDFQEASKLDINSIEEMNRHDRKRTVAFMLSTDKMMWDVPFVDALVYYQIYRDWKKVGKLTSDPRGTEYLKPYIEHWIKTDFVPDEYSFSYRPDPAKATDAVKELIGQLDEKMDALAIHNAVFEFAKSKNTKPEELFAEFYAALIGKRRGPRLGKLIYAIGVDRIKKDILGK
jgi:lysyl-tRNA synthetase class 1